MPSRPNTMTGIRAMKRLLAAGIGSVILAVGIVTGLIVVGGIVVVGSMSGGAGGAVMAMGGRIDTASSQCDVTPTAEDNLSTDGLKPAATKTQAEAQRKWGSKLETIYGVAPRDDHATGNAVDLMIPDYADPAQNKFGWEMANYFLDNARKFGITYIIFDSKIWANGATPDQSWTYSRDGKTYGPDEWAPYQLIDGMPNDDNQQHRNHVHISTTDEIAVSASGNLQLDRVSVVTPATSLLVPRDVPGFDEEQTGYIKAIIAQGKAAGVPEKGWVVALMTAFQESTMRNLDGGDRDSLGLFQQRPSTGWGSREHIKDPAYAAQAFYLGVGGNANPGLLSVSGWESMRPGEAAQTVQRSGFPDAYDKWEVSAKQLVEQYKGTPKGTLVTLGAVNTTPGSANSDDSSECSSGGGEPGSVNAAGDDYPGRNWVPDQGSVAGGLARECVDFTAWRMRQHTKDFDKSDPFFGTWYVLGNGADWGPAAKALGYEVDRNPKAGDIAYWNNNTFGHVAFVAEVKDNGNIVIEEYNMALPGGGSDHSYHTREISSGEPAGFIDFIGNPRHPLVPKQRSQMGGN